MEAKINAEREAKAALHAAGKRGGPATPPANEPEAPPADE